MACGDHEALAETLQLKSALSWRDCAINNKLTITHRLAPGAQNVLAEHQKCYTFAAQ